MKSESNFIHIPIWLFNGLCLFILFSKVSIFSPKVSLISLNNDLTVIGQFQSVKGLVKRSHSQSLSWFLAKQADSAFVGETVFTGENSFARLKIDDNIIDLKENSVIKLNKFAKDEYTISLIRGEVKGKVKDKFKVVFKDNLGEKKEVSLPVTEEKPISFQIEEAKEVKTEPLKPLFFENISANEIILSKNLDEENTLLLKWSGDKDKDVILKFTNDQGETVSTQTVKRKNSSTITIPKINERYQVSIQYLGEKEQSVLSFWALADEKVPSPKVHFNEEDKYFGEEGEFLINVEFSDFDFYMKYGVLYMLVYHEEKLLSEFEIKNIIGNNLTVSLGPHGAYKLELKGEVYALEESFSFVSSPFHFLPSELAKKLKLKNQKLEYELGLTDDD